MYLYEEVYLNNWPHNEEHNLDQYTDARTVLALAGIKPRPETGGYGVEVKTPVIYWRKANQVHLWFVNNVQKGVDDCDYYPLEDDKLAELGLLAQRVLDSITLVDAMVVNGQSMVDGEWKDNLEPGQVIQDSGLAEELLPPGEGFFFGGTGFDHWYKKDLEHTVASIGYVLKHRVEYSSFGYRSSW
jgi:hypothetical protein